MEADMAKDPAPEPGTLVVDTTELDVVKQFLAELEIAVVDEETETLPKFDLALLTLAHFDTTRVTNVDPVLAELRLRIAARCGGWTPFLGKNRLLVGEFNAYPQTKSMNFLDPKPVTVDTESFFADGGGSGIRVGLVDTAVYNHPDLARFDIRTDIGKFDVTPGKTYTVEEGHGVFAAGLVLQQAPEATILARQALGTNGKSAAWNVVTKLHDFLTEGNHVDIAVLASGCRTHDGQAPHILSRAIERLSEHTLVVAAAGNHGELTGISPDVHITRNSATWPAALPHVVSVGVAGPKGKGLATYSPNLPWVTCNVVPPAQHDGAFVSTYLKADDVQMHMQTPENDFDGYASWFGSSCAAAFLAGALAAQMSTNGKDAQKALRDLYGGEDVKEFAWQLSEPREQA
jgi:hypothetical protein